MSELKRTAPHHSPEVQALDDRGLWEYYQDLMFTHLKDLTHKSLQPDTIVIQGSPLYRSGAGPCSAAYDSWAMAFESPADLLDFLSILHVPTTPPLSKRPHKELIEEVHQLVERRRAEHEGAPPLQELVTEVNAVLNELIELSLMSFQEYVGEDDEDGEGGDPDWICGHFRSLWGRLEAAS